MMGLTNETNLNAKQGLETRLVSRSQLGYKSETKLLHSHVIKIQEMISFKIFA